MKLKHFLSVLLFLFIGQQSQLASCQDDFVLFTFYDQLTLSPDSNHLAFRCILLDESKPDKLFSNILIKDFSTNQLRCIDPFPERFIISKDKRYLLFSSIYGLYLIDLNKNISAKQICFRDPSVEWFFKDFGFYDRGKKIHIEKITYGSGETTSEFYNVNLDRNNSQSGSMIKKIESDNSKKNPYNLPVDKSTSSQNLSVLSEDQKLIFIPKADSKNPGNFELRFFSEKKKPDILIKNCRPRLMSLSPGKQTAIFSILKNSEKETYQFDFESEKLSLLGEIKYLSISWLDESRYIYNTEAGLFLSNTVKTIHKSLTRWDIPRWCGKIIKQFPRYELQVKFVEDKKEANELLSNLSSSFKRGRITRFQNKKVSGYRVRIGGYDTRHEALTDGKKLEDSGLSHWIDNIDDYYDFFNTVVAAETLACNNSQIVIEYKKDNYLRSRILFKQTNGKFVLCVPEMNNITNRSGWDFPQE